VHKSRGFAQNFIHGELSYFVLRRASVLRLCWQGAKAHLHQRELLAPACFLSFFFHPAIGIIASGGFLLAFLTDLSRVLRYWTPDSGEKSLRCPERKT
jgi:hypothetical protein